MPLHPLTRMTMEHLPSALALSKAVNWPHRLTDWQMLLSLSEGHVALHGDAVVGTALRTDYGCEVSVLNMIIVDKSLRGKGLGRELMDAAMAGAGDRELRLVATKEGLPLYTKLGFAAEAEIEQCQGHLITVETPASNVEAVAATDLDEIIQLDAQYWGAERSKLILWLAANAELVAIRDRLDRITSFAALRRFGRGWVIGPLQAPDPDEAKALIRCLAAPLRGMFIRIDTEKALGLSSWLETIGLIRAGGGTKMRKTVRTEPRPTFGLFSQALG